MTCELDIKTDTSFDKGNCKIFLFKFLSFSLIANANFLPKYFMLRFAYFTVKKLSFQCSAIHTFGKSRIDRSARINCSLRVLSVISFLLM